MAPRYCAAQICQVIVYVPRGNTTHRLCLGSFSDYVGHQHGHPHDHLARIDLRYVVANPSSYLYFSDERPDSQAIAGGTCPEATKWKYQLKDAPEYVSSQNVEKLESSYAARNVVYLLGEADTDPYKHFIDHSCAGMSQGPYRLARGLAYFDYMKKRHSANLKQKVVIVPSVGHDNLKMFTSNCGMAVLFNQAIPKTCPVITGAK